MLTKLLKSRKIVVLAALLSLVGFSLPGKAFSAPVAGAVSPGVLVETGPPQSISVTPYSTTVTVGDSLAFAATANYPDGTTVPVTRYSTWTSSIPAVARIQKAGAHRGNAVVDAAGEVDITAAYKGVTGFTPLVVQPPSATSQTFTEDGVFTPPPGVRMLTVEVEGGSGGASSFNQSLGAQGATVVAVLKLPRHANKLNVVVGVSGKGGTATGGGPGGASSFGPGGNGASGCGGGGGASGVFRGLGPPSQTSSLVVAGGGGGTCDPYGSESGGAAGTLSPGEDGGLSVGGLGGTDSMAGAGGLAPTYNDGTDPPITGLPGYPGDGPAGGDGNRYYAYIGPSQPFTPYWSGSGGGGGYFGGGGGAASYAGANGGGGSSFVAFKKNHGIKGTLVYASNQSPYYAQPGSVLIYWK
jgi:hypothetical protein